MSYNDEEYEYDPPNDFRNKTTYKPTFYPVNREFRLKPRKIAKTNVCNANRWRLTIGILCIVCLLVVTAVCIYYGNKIYTDTYRMYHQTTFTVTSYRINSVYDSDPAGLLCRDCDFGSWSDGDIVDPITCDFHNFTSKIVLRYPVADNDVQGLHSVLTTNSNLTSRTVTVRSTLYTIEEPGFCGDSYANTYTKDSHYWPIGRSDITGWYLISDPKVIEYHLQDGVILFLSAGLFGFIAILSAICLTLWYRNSLEKETMLTSSTVTNSVYY
jgi:hypothetical protein